MVKPKVLLCWGYHRPDWTEVFERIETSFDFHYLFFFSARLERGLKPSHPTSYWSSYSSPDEALRILKPQTIIFQGLDGPQAIALNIVAKRHKIPTVYLQHGVLLPLAQVEVNLVGTNEATDPDLSLTVKEKIHQLVFFACAVRFQCFQGLAFLVRWLWTKWRYRSNNRALAANPWNERLADYYVLYSKGGAREFFTERDCVPEERMIEIGCPHLDSYFGREVDFPESDYELFIDQPIYGVRDHPVALKTREAVQELYLRLAVFCSTRKARLVVKLHPNSYNEGPRISHPNVVFLEDVENLADLLLGSRAVYGYYSALLNPAFILKPCALFTLGTINVLQQRAHDLGLAELVPFEGLPDPDFHLSTKPEAGVKTFVRDSLFAADGKSAQRLQDLLTSLCKRSSQ